jgi:prepilin-type processing-associated H-X9-DG protein
MKSKLSSKGSEAAFNLYELGVLIVCVSLLALLMLPALAADKLQSASIGCLYNLRHLQTGCAMYSTENNDYLMPNAPLAFPNNETWCGGQAESWGVSAANTNPVVYESALLWPYLGGNLSAFRCPGDTVPSANGYRLRSYSMNGQMGAAYFGSSLLNFNIGYSFYSKASDIINPTPANAFVFADESPYTINDGYLQITVTHPGFSDVPACYLEGGCGFSFADGHAEIHRWQTTSLLIPVRQGFTGNSVAVGANNADWVWFAQHATSRK